jgi:hypothetical protein
MTITRGKDYANSFAHGALAAFVNGKIALDVSSKRPGPIVARSLFLRSRCAAWCRPRVAALARAGDDERQPDRDSDSHRDEKEIV